MTGQDNELLKAKCTEQSYEKLAALKNSALIDFVARFVAMCNPQSVYVCDGSGEDRAYIRNKAVEKGEEKPLALEGHTIHFDGPKDQARDKANTKYLLSAGTNLGSSLNSTDKQQGLEEVYGYFSNIMAGKEMCVLFFCLGPTDSEFSIPCVQITDSYYVAHSEYILYRRGYDQFKKLGDSGSFLKFVHGAGEIENGVSKNVDKRRVYIDLEDYTVYSTNTQYAGNTVGLKKLALRLAIRRASEEGWLAEHMMITGIKGPMGRISYFAGAFPSACGKTSTAMLKGETIVGDDIAYLRVKDGKIRGVNVECGIFGIIRDVNADDDPVIWETLNTPGEIIVSNILVVDGQQPYWLGDKRETPEKGINFSGEWTKGKKDAQGNEIPHAHKNARYTVSLYALKNVDKNLDNSNGVEVKGVVYGGRDSSIWPPVQQSFDWAHGVVTMGAALESETTAATLGQEGVRQFNPMSNLDFVSLPLGRYIANHLSFAKDLKVVPSIFSVNYFLRGTDGEYLTEIDEKHVWIKWAELRVNNNVDVIKTPTGYIPKYDDLKKLFAQVLKREYPHKSYVQEFTLRIPENLEKIDRIIEIYHGTVSDTPQILFDVLNEQKERLQAMRKQYGDYVAPDVMQKIDQ